MLTTTCKLEIMVSGFSKESFINIKEDAMMIDVDNLKKIDCDASVALVVPESNGEYIIFQIKDIKPMPLIIEAMKYIELTYKDFTIESLYSIIENGKTSKFKIIKKSQ
jgi:hypothetical protein